MTPRETCFASGVIFSLFTFHPRVASNTGTILSRGRSQRYFRRLLGARKRPVAIIRQFINVVKTNRKQRKGTREMQLRVLTRSLCVVYLQTAAVCLAGDPFPEKDYPNVVAPVAEFGSYGTGLGEMNEPVGLAISRDNKLFIAESYNARVQVFSCDGKAVRAWRGTDKGELTCTRGI